MNKITRLGACLSALIIVAGTAACGASSASTAGSPSRASSAAPAAAAEVVQHRPAEVKKFLDAFLASVSNESDAYIKKAMTGGAAAGTDEEKAAKFKAAFPESYKYLALDDKKAAGLVGIFALIAMVTRIPK
jgi:hypothetical protein